MEFNKTVVGALVAACITAALGGGYLANRRQAPAPAAQPEVAISSDPAAGSVDQSEGVIQEEPAQEAVVPANPPRSIAPAVRPERVVSPTTRPRETVAATPSRTPSVSPAPVAAPTREIAREPSPAAVEASRVAEVEPSRPVEPPAPQFEDLVVSADSVIGLHLETALTSETARVEDEVLARVTRDVRVGDRVAIPAGAKAHGEVTLVERGGKVRDRARLGIRFTSIVLADGTRVPLDTETIYREGDSASRESAAKIGGGAIGGAIIGGILGGAKGAILGGSAGAGAGTAVVMAGGRNAASFPPDAPVTVRLMKPATVTVEK